MAFSPSVSAVVAVIAQVPFVTTPLPITVVPSSKVTVAPVSPVPVKLDRATLVRSSLLETPLSLLSARLPGAAGAVVSKVTFSAPDATEVLPAASVWVAVMPFRPSLSAVVAVIAQVPFGHHAAANDGGAVQQGDRGARLTRAGEADRATLVRSSLLETPLSLLSTRLPGAAGVVVSKVTFKAVEATEVLPARSVWVAVMAFNPSVSAVVAVIAQVPFVTTPLPMTVVPSPQGDCGPGLTAAGEGRQSNVGDVVAAGEAAVAAQHKVTRRRRDGVKGKGQRSSSRIACRIRHALGCGDGMHALGQTRRRECPCAERVRFCRAEERGALGQRDHGERVAQARQAGIAE